ncbi:unnamed protein product [Parnassius apollo]|uniref:(apollo) hypothetical protein n=1 Tax=Parnassius apollo TaxID=110799 RepID=A0A8S3XEX5_PARAO|nr:unnamed protein product [Parnassius apollo]
MCDPLILLLLLVEVKVTPNSRTTQIVLKTKPGGFEVIPVVSNPNELNNDYKSVISKNTGKELQLLADCKTRWGSISTMVDRFNRLRSCVSKALIDMNSDIKFTQSEFHTLDNFQKSLNIIKVTVEAQYLRNATLLTADAAMKFMLRKLDSQNSTLSRLLARSLRVRISQRRLSIASTLQYLQNLETYFNEVANA